MAKYNTSLRMNVTDDKRERSNRRGDKQTKSNKRER